METSNSNRTSSTFFASPQRDDAASIKTQSGDFARNTDFVNTLSVIPQTVLVLNENRQIIYANEAIIKAFGFASLEAISGLRPGEAFGCVHAKDAPSGCGTSESCRYCGAVAALLAALDGNVAVRTASVLVHQDGKTQSLEFEITVVPFPMGAKKVLLCFIRDVSDKLRKDYFESVFFHDILNLAGLVSSYSDFLLDNEVSGELKFAASRISGIADALISEIKYQRTMSDADSHALTPEPDSVDPVVVLNKVAEMFAFYRAGSDKHISISNSEGEFNVITDPVLLQRVFMNMLKNALEASGKGETVFAECKKDGENVIVSVKNSAVMPADVQKQVFTRYFSTKGHGRGLGTYGMKLLVENYLCGQVSFISNPESGTVFSVSLPPAIK
ncbi:MAG: HAMP domain-containing sensor histidine kinase [Elusimicrobiaceae bacterium]|jgi:hypothetical protein